MQRDTAQRMSSKTITENHWKNYLKYKMEMSWSQVVFVAPNFTLQQLGKTRSDEHI